MKLFGADIEKAQNHTVNIIFEDHFEGLVEFLESKGIKVKFVAPGLINSDSVLFIEKDEEGTNK